MLFVQGRSEDKHLVIASINGRLSRQIYLKILPSLRKYFNAINTIIGTVINDIKVETTIVLATEFTIFLENK